MLKRLGKIIFLIWFLLIIFNIYLKPETNSAKEIIYGDVNQDGVVNNYDIIILNKHILGEMELGKNEKIASDVNLDNLINKYDVELINFSLLNKISLPNTTYTDFEIDKEKIENEYIEEENKEELVVTDEKYLKEYETKNGEKYTIIGTLKIEKIGIEYDIFSATSTELLKLSLNKYWGVDPNEVGNMCIVGHNWFDSRFFGRLHTLEEGDSIEITDAYNRMEKYYVYDMFVVEPNDTDCTSQLTNGKKEITLITCYNNGTQRLVVKARAEKNINVSNERL